MLKVKPFTSQVGWGFYTPIPRGVSVPYPQEGRFYFFAPETAVASMYLRQKYYVFGRIWLYLAARQPTALGCVKVLVIIFVAVTDSCLAARYLANGMCITNGISNIVILLGLSTTGHSIVHCTATKAEDYPKVLERCANQIPRAGRLAAFKQDSIQPHLYTN